MEDFEAIHPDSQVNRHQDIKNWETFYYAASRLIDECTTIVATQDGEVIGLVNYMCASAYGTINYLYVLPNWRSQGVGKALLENAEKQCTAGYYEKKHQINRRKLKGSQRFPNGCDECD